MEIGEIAPAPAGDPYFLRRFAGMVDHDDPSTAFSRLRRAHQTRRARADDQDIYLNRVHN